MSIPPEYQGREQTYLKHQILGKYLQSWGQKLASIGRQKRVRIWYVDCFAGPWQSEDEALEDTSVMIGLRALGEAVDFWTKEKEADVEAHAVFVEAKETAYDKLVSAVEEHAPSTVKVHPLKGEFRSRVGGISGLLANDPAFLLIDPTGWKGVAMRYIRPLAEKRLRDVMVNVMFAYINRFKDDPRGFLRRQMRDFFGMTDQDLPEGLNEDGLMRFYREQLRQRCYLQYTADLAVPHPTADRTFFRLVVGGHHPKVVELFRDVEASVVGKEAGKVRDAARRKREESRTGQQWLAGIKSERPYAAYSRMREAGRTAASRGILEQMGEGPIQFRELWPRILEDNHIRKKDVADLVRRMELNGELEVENRRPRERTVKDDHMIAQKKR